MQLRRVLPLVGVLLTTAATASIVAACGGDDKTIYVYVEAGATDAGGTRDASQVVIPGDDDDSGSTASSCQPGTPAPFTFKPPARYQNKCSDAAIDAILADCVFGSDVATCNGTQAANADCFSCLVGTPQDTTGHPLLVYNTEVGPIASTAACMAAFKGDGTKATDCSNAFGEVETCAYEACIPNCLGADVTQDDFQKCLSTAISGGTCTTGEATFATTACQDQYGDPAKVNTATAYYGFCAVSDLPDGGTLTNGDYYSLLAHLVCGAPPADAGTPDAGPDAGDAGDAATQ